MAEQLSVIRILTALPLLVLAASCASMPPGRDDSADLATELTDKVAEKPRSCISLDDASGAKIFDDAILYRTSRRLSYVNAAKGCRTFDSDPIFVNHVQGSQLCRGDVVRTVSRSGGIPGPFCVLGDFTPYRTAKR
jgi:hypothetical protein